MKYRVGIDIGGTKVLFGIVTERAEIVASKKIPMQAHKPPEEAIEYICAQLQNFLAEHSVSLEDVGFLGAGVPGTARLEDGYVDYCPNVNFVDTPAGDFFFRQLGRTVKISQDCRLAAWAEHLFGAGRDVKDFACITLGTGIGCGLILGGQIAHGALNTAGEIGHLVVEIGGRLCACGGRGHLERYASGTGILITAQETMPDLLGEDSRTEDVFRLAYQGEPRALAAIGDAVEKLGTAVINLMCVLSLERVVISGGMCVHDKLLIQPLIRYVAEHGYVSWNRQNRFSIVKAELGEVAPMIGAAFLDKALG